MTARRAPIGKETAAPKSVTAQIVEAVAMAAPQQDNSKSTIVFEFHLGGLSNTRRIDMQELMTSGAQPVEPVTTEEGKIDYASLAGTKRMIHQRFLKSICKLDNDYRRWLEVRAIPGLSDMLATGMRMLPLTMIDEVDTYTEVFIEKRKGLVDMDIRARYDEIKADAKKRLKGIGPDGKTPVDLFREQDFPDVDTLCDGFTVRRRFLSFNAPGEMQKLNAELYEKEKRRIAAEWEEALKDVRVALRAGFNELIGKLNERLSVDEDGRPKKFTEATLNAFNDFLNTFDQRNLTDDVQLRTLVDKARGLIAGVTKADVKSDSDFRASLANKFKKVGDQVAKLATVKAPRGAGRMLGSDNSPI